MARSIVAVLLGLGWLMRAAPSSGGSSLERAGASTFEFAPLLAAGGLLVVALLLRRGVAPQREVEGLV